MATLNIRPQDVGADPAGKRVHARLCNAAGERVRGYRGSTGVLVAEVSGNPDEDTGMVVLDLVPNADIEPANTGYRISAGGWSAIIVKGSGDEDIVDVLVSSLDPLAPIELGSANAVAYSPADPGDWTDPDPETVAEALDSLAANGGGGGGGGQVDSVVAGAGVSVDSSDPENPVVTAEVTQAELNAEAALARNADNLTSGTVADARIPSGIARDSEVTAAVAAEAALARNADNLTSGTVADARIASTIARDSEVTSAISALSTVYQPLDSDLTAIAALTTTSYGRAFLALADAAAGRTALGLGTAAVEAASSFQPVDSDLTAIAALTTTAYGRALLTLADLSALRAVLGPSGTPSGSTFLRGDGTWAVPAGGGSGVVETIVGDAPIQVDDTDPANPIVSIDGSGYQPIDSDLTAIAALSTTSFGRSVLTQADAAALRTLAGLVIGTNVQAFDSDLSTIAAANNGSVLAATTASFLTADETKLDGIEAGADVTDATNVAAAGAVMESDTSTASMSFVIDEDDMASNSATKVPTQQSVKAYVDDNAGGGSSLVTVDDPSLWAGSADDEEFDRNNQTSLPSGWSWVQQGSTTYRERFGSGTFQMAAESSLNLRGIKMAIPSGAWTATAKISISTRSPSGNTVAVGLFVGQSSDGKKAGISYQSDGISSQHHSGLSSFGGHYLNDTTSSWTNIGRQLIYLRMEWNAGTYTVSISFDGMGWAVLDAARSVTGQLSGTIDELCLLAFQTANIAWAWSVDWIRFE